MRCQEVAEPAPLEAAGHLLHLAAGQLAELAPEHLAASQLALAKAAKHLAEAHLSELTVAQAKAKETARPKPALDVVGSASLGQPHIGRHPVVGSASFRRPHGGQDPCGRYGAPRKFAIQGSRRQ